jgi:hypothetical protein
MAVRPTGKIRSKLPDAEEPVANPLGQGKRPEIGQFRLQVDRQTKASYLTIEEAEQAGLTIKQNYPIVQVAVYDAAGGTRKFIELPTE